MTTLPAADQVLRAALSLKPDFDSGRWRWALAGPGLALSGAALAADRQDAVLCALHELAGRTGSGRVEVAVTLPASSRFWALTEDISRSYPGLSVAPYAAADEARRAEAMAALDHRAEKPSTPVAVDPVTLPRLTVATDGSARAGHLGWGWLADDGRHGLGATRLRRGAVTATCLPLLAELSAIDAAVAALPGRDLLVRTDSRHAITLVGEWIAGGDRMPTGYRVQRHVAEGPGGLVRLQQRLQCEGERLSFAWVRGHTGDPLNEGADSIAKLARRHSDGTWGLTAEEIPARAAGIASAFASADDRHRIAA